jgi:hypothetical protein
VTFIHVACTGAEITEGLFGSKPAREQLDQAKTVPSQLSQLFDLLCEGTRETFKVRLRIPVYYGGKRMKNDNFFVRGCPRNQLKRQIDLVLLSFGGNDVGFSALVGYSIIDRAGKVAPGLPLYEALTGQRATFGPDVARVYMAQLDRRFATARRFLETRLNVPPSRVIQTAYEPIQQSASGQACDGTGGLDVHPGFRFLDARLRAVDRFTRQFFARLACIAGRQQVGGCPANLATGQGTGFVFVRSHQGTFSKRGVCAADANDGTMRYLQAAAIRPGTTDFQPWEPWWFHPYGPRRRLFVSPNDAFLTANTHKDGAFSPSLDAHEQLLYASLYSGAFHRTAEAHAIVADHVYRAAVKVVKPSD